jgi:hypothetical protein
VTESNELELYKPTSLWDFAAYVARALEREECAALETVFEVHSFESRGGVSGCVHCSKFAEHSVDWPCETVSAAAVQLGAAKP